MARRGRPDHHVLTRSDPSRTAPPLRKRSPGPTLAVLVAAVLVTGCSTDAEPTESTGTVPPVWTGSTAPLTTGEIPGHPGHSPGGNVLSRGFLDANGGPAGTVTFVERAGFVEVRAEVSGLEPGFHGFHIHERGLCEPDSTPPGGGEPGDFLSAGGHMQAGGRTSHPASGDLTSIHVREGGTGTLVTSSEAFTLDDLRNDGQGRAVIVHADPDNFANIPTRYSLPGGDPVPDEQTLSTGDAGARVACAVIE